jgi:phytoene dehydrogenase-like protein
LLDTASSVPRVIAAIPRCLLLLRWIRATLEEFLDTCTENRKLRAVFAGQCGNYGMPPSEVSVLVPAAVALHYLQGAYFPKGGGQVISDRLAEAIEARGGKVLLRARVRRILVEQGSVQGVEFESKHVGRQHVRSPIVVSNADLKHTMCKLVGPEHLDEQSLRRFESLNMSLATGVLYAGIRGDLRAEGHPNTNYWVHPKYDLEELFATTRRGDFYPNPFVYMSIASLKNPGNRKVSPEGVTNLQLMSLAPSQPQSWGVSESEFVTGAYRNKAIYRQRKADFARRLVTVARRVLPDIDRRIVFQEVATPLTHRRYTGANDGTPFGIATSPEQMLHNRPGPRTAIRGLYLCGANCRSGPGIVGVTVSGLMTAEAILRERIVTKVLRG